MKKGLLNNIKIEPACGLCVHGMLAPDGESVLCIKTGVRNYNSKCRRFKYDPLKRDPRRITLSANFTKEDFEL